MAPFHRILDARYASRFQLDGACTRHVASLASNRSTVAIVLEGNADKHSDGDVPSKSTVHFHPTRRRESVRAHCPPHNDNKPDRRIRDSVGRHLSL
ncbi:hypothetical protein A5775_02325 [Mycobacterium sp. 852002-10029_SCH5224772]|nr:hypothetical protein A5775_02325 [Mycobacterium sp. 852002-10029_SCH5224772]